MSAKAATNPATASVRLAQLAAKYPAEVLHNPVLPLLLLENPAWLSQLPADTLAALLHVPDAPASLATALLTAAQAAPMWAAWAVRLALVNYPGTPPAVLARLAQDEAPAVRNAVRYRAAAPPPAHPAEAVRDTLLLGLPPYLATQAPYLGEVLATLINQPGTVPTERLGWLRQVVSAELIAEQAALVAALVAARGPGWAAPLDPLQLPFAAAYLETALRRPDLTLAQRLRLVQPLAARLPGSGRARSQNGYGDDWALFRSLIINRVVQDEALPAPAAELAARPDWLSQAVAAAHPDTPAALRHQLLATAPHELVWQAVALNPAWTPAELRQLLADDRHRTRGRALLLGLAQNPRTPPDVLQAVLDRTRPGPSAQPVWEALGAHPQLPAAALAPLLEALATYEAGEYGSSPERFRAVAVNPATPPALLLWLGLQFFAPEPASEAQDGLSGQNLPPLCHWLPQLPTELVHGFRVVVMPAPEELRGYLLASELPPAWRELLLAHPHPLPTRLGGNSLLPDLAANPSTPPDLLAQLATNQRQHPDHSGDLRAALARNPATPAATLRELAAGRSLEIVRLALAHPAYPAPAPTDSSETARRWQATQPAAGPSASAALARLATDKASAVRVLVAENPAAAPATLTQLAPDKIGAVRAAVAAHPATPVPTLETLARDADSLVVRGVAAHPATPPALLAELVLNANKFVRRAALANPQLPAEILPKLVKEKSLENRLLLLHRPEGRRALLHSLADQDLAAALLLHLLLPEALTPAHHAALAASPLAAHRLAVAHLPEFQQKMHDDPHLLVRLVARGELAPPANQFLL